MNTQDLKTTLMDKTEKKPILKYDEVLDAILIYFTDTETERIITHFVDDNVALLYRHSDKEVVGIRIEYFKEEFLPKIVEMNGWKLSDTGEKLGGGIDISFKAIEVQKVVTSRLTLSSSQLTIPHLNKKLKFETVHAQ